MWFECKLNYKKLNFEHITSKPIHFIAIFTQNIICRYYYTIILLLYCMNIEHLPSTRQSKNLLLESMITQKPIFEVIVSFHQWECIVYRLNKVLSFISAFPLTIQILSFHHHRTDIDQLQSISVHECICFRKYSRKKQLINKETRNSAHTNFITTLYHQ